MREIFEFENFRVDPLSRALLRDNAPVALNRRAFDVLLYLVQHPGRVVTKEELLQSVWPDAHVEENNLTQSISALRKALEERPGANSFIATLPGRGYQFIAQVNRLGDSPESAPEAGPSGSGILLQQRTVTTSVVTVQERARFRPGVLATFFAVLGLLVCTAIYEWTRHATPLQLHKLVVADFVNSTGDATFDRTLKRALEIDLEQSPYLDVLSESDGANTLQLMGVKSDAALTEDVAREICVRTNRQVVLLGSIASMGGRYLVSLQAADCNTGKGLASAKMEAASKEKILSALDSVADHVRAKLGESAKSITSYQVAIEQATTPSLEALRAYSMGNLLAAQGRPATESLPFYRRAVELDSHFAMAYDALGVAYYHLDEYELSLANLQKAMDLSDRVSEREKLMLRANYYSEGDQNVQLGLETYRLWATTYPQDPRPVVALVSLYTSIGQPQQGAVFGEQALSVQPENGLLYQAVIRACTHAGMFAEAKALGTRAAQLALDNSHIHASLWQVAYAEHNAADLERETQWAQSHADGWYGWFFPDLQAGTAASEGRYQASQSLYAKSVAVAKQEGLDDLADHLIADQAATEAALGELIDLRLTLQHIAKPELHDINIAMGRVALGDVAYAENILASESRKSNSGFYRLNIDLPCLRAAIALARSRPLEAISALEDTRSYDLADYSLAFFRGKAYLKVGRSGQAIAEYREILNNPGIDPANPQFALARLGLARAYAEGGDKSDARTEYRAFLTMWKDADPNLSVLKAAKTELADLY